MRDKAYWLDQLRSGADYRKLAMSCHPDTGRGTHEEFVALQAAKDQIENPIDIDELLRNFYRRQYNAYQNDSTGPFDANWRKNARERKRAREQRQQSDHNFGQFWSFAEQAKKAKARYATGKSRDNFAYAESNFHQFEDILERMRTIVRENSFNKEVARQLRSLNRSYMDMFSWISHHPEREGRDY